MGSDSSPVDLFAAVLHAAQHLKDVNLVVFATRPIVETIAFGIDLAHIEFHSVSDVIEMEDDPLLAVRQKKNSSLVVGVRLLKKRYLDGFISAGNTGAFIASATLSLPLLAGIKRPALLATLPTEKGYVAVIDVGGSVSCKAHHLVQFAYIGAAYQRCSHGIDVPRVGLLNIGVESKKGTSEVRQAYQTLQRLAFSNSEAAKMRFIGNIEGREVFQGKVDVLITDGFTGNVLLKTSEGVSFFILNHLKQSLKDLSPELQHSILNHFRHHFDYEEYEGAIICGIDTVAVKCHGQSSAKGFFNAIIGAAELVRNGFINQIKLSLSKNLSA